jgi:hypothetical protein
LEDHGFLFAAALREEVVDDDDQFPVRVHDCGRTHVGVLQVVVQDREVLWVQFCDEIEVVLEGGVFFWRGLGLFCLREEMAVVDLVVADCQ